MILIQLRKKNVSEKWEKWKNHSLEIESREPLDKILDALLDSTSATSSDPGSSFLAAPDTQNYNRSMDAAGYTRSLTVSPFQVAELQKENHILKQWIRQALELNSLAIHPAIHPELGRLIYSGVSCTPSSSGGSTPNPEDMLRNGPANFPSNHDQCVNQLSPSIVRPNMHPGHMYQPTTQSGGTPPPYPSTPQAGGLRPATPGTSQAGRFTPSTPQYRPGTPGTPQPGPPFSPSQRNFGPQLPQDSRMSAFNALGSHLQQPTSLH